MRILIRADASKDIGTGHVMRCLVLADLLLDRGARCEFICRALDGHLASLIETRGHTCVLLAAATNGSKDAGYASSVPPHSHWLQAHWEQDALATLEIVRAGQAVDMLIVDHYALDHRWESQLKPHAGFLMIMDDLADRQHNGDILLDQNYGHEEQDYSELIPAECRVLAGSQFALLRPQFAELRPETLRRRQLIGSDREIMVFLGGGDTGNVLELVSRTLCAARPERISAIILVTAGDESGPVVHSMLQAQFGNKIKSFERVEDMAAVMSKADLAIGGGGVAGWERCALGLPTLVLTMSENQRPINQKLAQDGCIFACVEPQVLNQNLMAEFAGMDAATYRQISDNAARVTDGKGANTVMSVLENHIR